MLIPDQNGEYSYNGIHLTHYYAFVDSFYRIIELFTTEEGEKYVEENEWEDLNDIEKHVALSRGWDIPALKEKRRIREQNCTQQAEVIPFPRGT